MHKYKVNRRVMHGPWGEYDGTTYSIVTDDGTRIATCDDEDQAKFIVMALNIYRSVYGVSSKHHPTPAR